jgi:hypothetical protein
MTSSSPLKTTRTFSCVIGDGTSVWVTAAINLPLSYPSILEPCAKQRPPVPFKRLLLFIWKRIYRFFDELFFAPFFAPDFLVDFLEEDGELLTTSP